MDEVRWAGHVARMEQSRNAYRIYAKQLGRRVQLQTISYIGEGKTHGEMEKYWTSNSDDYRGLS